MSLATYRLGGGGVGVGVGHRYGGGMLASVVTRVAVSLYKINNVSFNTCCMI